MDYTWKPIDTWPRTPTPTTKRIVGGFAPALSSVLEELERETRLIGAQRIILRTYHMGVPQNITREGRLKADAKAPTKVGVVLTFELLGDYDDNLNAYKRIPYTFACDKFGSWLENLRAIAKTLNHLRMIEDFGCTESREQYQGFAQIPGMSEAKPEESKGEQTRGKQKPPPRPKPPPRQKKQRKPPPVAAAPLSRFDAAATLLHFSAGSQEWTPDDLMRNPIVAETIFRQAAKNTHPDKGGDGEDFLAVYAAIERLRTGN